VRADAPEAELARAAVAGNELWYHTMEVAPGVVTPGWFDLRPVLDTLPWPDIEGKRCLDVGTYDGHLAFELERRGAAEVVATDIADHELWDWPPRTRAEGPEVLRAIAGGRKGRGFEIARELLGSAVERKLVSAYDLDPNRVGTFDVVVCGSLMLHLRDPVGALEAIRTVCRGCFLSAEQIDLSATLLHPRRPVFRLDGMSERLQWWVPNAAGHRRLVEAAGFDIEQEARTYSAPYGVSHPPRDRSAGGRLRSLARRAVTGGDGVPHHAMLARPAI
jgi:tRNA (mo5U34)-methyltransferase